MVREEMISVSIKWTQEKPIVSNAVEYEARPLHSTRLLVTQ